MKKQLETRLNELKNEYGAGQKMLDELQVKEMEMQKTLLRIAGAIQVLEEEIEKCEAGADEVSEDAEIVDMRSEAGN